MVAMWLVILLALLGLGGVAIVVAAAAIAAAKNRPGLAVLATALGLGTLLIGGLTAALFVGYQRAGPVWSEYPVLSEYHVGPVHWQFNGPVDGPFEGRTTWLASGLRLLLIGGGVIAFVMLIARQLRSEKCLGKHRIGWSPMLLLMLATVAMLGFVGLRWSSAPVHHRQQVAYHQAEEAARRAQQIAEETQHRVASMKAEIVNGTAQLSINDLEDKYTAPRIPLPPPAAPAPPSMASVSEAEAATAVEVVEAIEPPPTASDADPAEDEEQNATEPSEEDSSVGEADTEESDNDATSDDVGDKSNSAEPSDDAADESAAAEEAATEESASEDSSDHANVEDPTDAIEATAASTEPQGERGQRAAATHAASVAIKEMTAGLASFANAMNQVIDQYAERAAAEASAQKKLGTVAAEIAATTSKSPRPHWLEEGPKKIGNVQRDIIATDEYATEQECYRARDIYLLLATYEHLAHLVGLQNYENYAESSRPNLTLHHDYVLADGQVIVSYGRLENHRLRQLESMGIGVEYVRREIGKKEHFETIARSFGPMKKLYTLVEFNDSVDRDLQRRWEAHRRQERFALVGMGSGSILGVLGLVWGLLKVDTATKGYYTKRLLLGVPLGILGAFGIFMLLVVLQTPS